LAKNAAEAGHEPHCKPGFRVQQDAHDDEPGEY